MALSPSVSSASLKSPESSSLWPLTAFSPPYPATVERTSIGSVSPPKSHPTSFTHPDPDMTESSIILDRKESGTVLEMWSLLRQRKSDGTMQVVKCYLYDDSACPEEFTECGAVVENEEDMYTLTFEKAVTKKKSGSGSIHGKERNTTVSPDSCTVARPRRKKIVIMEEIFEEYFKKFWWFVDVDIFAYDKKPSDLVFTIKDHPEALKGIKSTFCYNGKRVGLRKMVFVDRVPANVEDDEFKNFFSQHGLVLESGITRNGEAYGFIGFGFVIFSTKKEATSLVNKCKQDPIELGGGKIIIKKAKIKTEPDYTQGPWRHAVC